MTNKPKAPKRDPACAADGSCCPPADGDGRKAVAVDAGGKAANLKRLRRIEGQIRGLQRMVEDDRYCGDVLTQLGAVQEALRSVGKELMRNHLRHCAAQAIRGGGPEADDMYDELVELFYKNAR